MPNAIHRRPRSFLARRPQLPADQPHTAPARHALHGLVQQDRKPARARSLDRRVAPLRGPRSERSREDGVPEPARLLHPRAQARRPADRSGSRGPDQPLRRDRRRVRPDRRRSADPGQGLPVHAAGSAARPGARRRSTATAATSRCGSRRACTTASTRRTTAASSRSPTSRATPGTPTRSPSRASSACSARTSAPSCARGSTPNGALMTLVPVASILVASIRLHFLDVLLHLKYPGPRVIAVRRAVPARVRRWAGSSSARRSSCSRRAASRSARASTTGSRHPDGAPLLRLP